MCAGVQITAQIQYGVAMKLSLDSGNEQHLIRSYAPGQVVIDNMTVTQSVIVTPNRIIQDWPPESVQDITHEHLSVFAELNLEIVILGTGARQQFLKPEFQFAIMQPPAKLLDEHPCVGLEMMDTAAACRTYNILSSEGRNVAAALFMI